MSAPRMLELFAGQGGATKGYQRAGWEVWAVDLDPNALKRNPATGVHVGDALTVLADLIAGRRVRFVRRDGTTAYLTLDDFDAIHASPPCQGYTIATAGNPAARAKHVRLIAATRELLILTGLPWVIENVEQAKSQMRDPIMLCGRMFGLGATDEDGLPLVLDRHRLFESNVHLYAPEHPKHGREQVAGVYGGGRARKPGATAAEHRRDCRVNRGGGYVPRSTAVKQALLGIGWMTVKGMQESIPPVYAQWVGSQMLEHLGMTKAVA